MLMNQNAPTPGLPVFISLFSRLVAKLLAERAHCDVVLQLKDGKVQLVRVNRSYLPGELPQV